MNVIQQIERMSHPFLDGKTKRLLIDGKWVEAASGKTFASINPATGEVLATVAEGDAQDIDRAVAAARRAFDGPWSKIKPFERQLMLLRLADLVERHFEELSMLDTLDMGAPISRTFGTRQRVLGMLRYYAGMATALHGETIENSLPGEIFSYTLKEPVGVVGAIIPWNGPLGASVWKIGPALATGCTVVLKPAEQTPLTALRLARLIQEAGIPDGVVNIVTGFGETAGAALAAHPGVDKIAFTGETRTGIEIMKSGAETLKKITLELGGKSPNIVFADADLEAAVKGATLGIFYGKGEVCAAGSRLFVERKVHDEFMDKLVARTKKMVPGDPLDPKTRFGAIVSQAQMEKVLGYIASGKAEGARLVAGGEKAQVGSLKGNFLHREFVLLKFAGQFHAIGIVDIDH